MAQPDFGILRPVDVVGNFYGAYDAEKGRQAQAAQQMFSNQQQMAQMDLRNREEQRQAQQHSMDADLKRAQRYKLADEDFNKAMEYAARQPSPENLAFAAEKHFSMYPESRQTYGKQIMGLLSGSIAPEERQNRIAAFTSQFVKPTVDEFSKVEESYTPDGRVQPKMIYKSGKTADFGNAVAQDVYNQRKASAGGNPSYDPRMFEQDGKVLLGDFDRRTRTWNVPGLDQTRPFRPLDASATIQAQVAAAKAEGGKIGDAQGTAVGGLQGVRNETKSALDLLDKLAGSEDGKVKPHAGYKDVVGATLLPGARFVSGTQAAGYDAMLEQIQGQSFLQAFEKLKGAGAITEIEGTKATQAINRMKARISEKDFQDAAKDLRSIIRKGLVNAEAKAASSTMGAGAAGAQVNKTKSGATVGKW